MAVIVLQTFSGEIPRTTPRLLENTQASVAINCDLRRGALEALRSPAKVERLTTASAHAIFKHVLDGWMAWAEDVSVIKSAVPDVDGDSPLGHIIICGNKPYPTQYLAGGITTGLGLPRPGTAPAVTVHAPTAPAVPAVVERSTAYCYTYVRNLAGGVVQQESAPSPPSPVVDVQGGGGATISIAPPEGADVGITHVRIYRTVSGAQSSEFRFLAELPVRAEAYLDTRHDKDVPAEVLRTSLWDSIPDDAHGLIKTDNGIYAAFRGNELLVSEPFVPYAFPSAYRKSVEDRIVALAHVDNAIIVLTTGRPYMATGSMPESLSLTHLPIEQACVSASSVASLPGGVVYASPDGLMLFTTGEQTLATARTWTREQWQAMGPENLMGAIHDGRYVGFFRGSNKGFLFTVGVGDVIRVELPDDWKVQALCHHSEDDAVYMAVDTAQGSGIYKFEAGEPMPYHWRSKPFYSSTLTSMSAVRVEAEAGEGVTVEVFGPDARRPRASLRIGDDRARRIRPTRSEKLWSLQLSGKTAVYEARLGSGIEEVERGQ